MELVGLGKRLHGEFGGEEPGQLLVLRERSGTVTRSGVGEHQLAVGGLVERVKCDATRRELDSGIEVCVVASMGGQSVEGLIGSRRYRSAVRRCQCSNSGASRSVEPSRKSPR